LKKGKKIALVTAEQNIIILSYFINPQGQLQFNVQNQLSGYHDEVIDIKFLKRRQDTVPQGLDYYAYATNSSQFRYFIRLVLEILIVSSEFIILVRRKLILFGDMKILSCVSILLPIILFLALKITPSNFGITMMVASDLWPLSKVLEDFFPILKISNRS